MPSLNDRVHEDPASKGTRFCPSCGSIDVQIDQGLAECDQCQWSGAEKGLLCFLSKSKSHDNLAA